MNEQDDPTILDNPTEIESPLPSGGEVEEVETLQQEVQEIKNAKGFAEYISVEVAHLGRIEMGSSTYTAGQLADMSVNYFNYIKNDLLNHKKKDTSGIT